MSDETPADVIEQAARVMHRHRCCAAEDYPEHHLSTWINTACALSAAGLLADPADRDERGDRFEAMVEFMADREVQALELHDNPLQTAHNTSREDC